MSLSVTQDLLAQADFATRTDLSRLGAELGARIDKLDLKIDKLAVELGGRIDLVNSRIDKLDAKIDNVNTSLSAQIDRLTWKVGTVVAILVFAASHIDAVLRFVGQLAHTP